MEGQQIKTLVDTGMCASMIVLNWVKHLGKGREVDRRVEIPEDLQGITGEGVGIIGWC